MVIIAILGLVWQRPDPAIVMSDLIGHYEKLKSFSAKVVHHGDFASDAKDSTDSLSWLSPKRFEIVSDKPSNPKLFSDGKKITTFIPDVAPIAENLENGMTKISPWETRGGIILSMLMRSPMAGQMLRPKKPVKATYAYGKALNWHSVPVTEIVESLSLGGVSEKVSYYLAPDCKTLVGIEVLSGPELSWTQYTDAAENPTFAKTLGNASGL